VAEGPPTLYVAKDGYFSSHEGSNRPIYVKRGAVADARHSIIDAAPEMWQPLTVDYDVTTTDEDKE
jgi:hypothetical protein